MTITINPYEKSEAKPVKWIGRRLDDRRQVCIIEAETWVKARELVRAMLRTDDIDVIREEIP